MKKRILALLLCLAMALSLLAGCGSTNGDTSAADASTSAEIPQEAREDLVKYLSDGDLSADTVLVKVNGSDVTAEYYLYWLGYYYSQMSAYYNYYGQAMDLTAQAEDGSTMADSLQSMADQAVASYTSMVLNAIDHGIELTDEDKKTVSSYASEQEENYRLYNCATVGAIEHANTDYLYYSAFGDLLYGEGGEFAPTEEDLNAYAEEKGAYNCRYILCQVEKDADEETEKAAKETCQGYFDELSALSGEEQLNRFKELQANNPDGNVEEFSFDSSSSLTDGFREKLAEMQIGELGMTDKTGYGYFVLLRLAPDMEALSDDYKGSDFAKKLEDWAADIKVENTADYEKLDAIAVLTKLQTLQAAVVAAETPTEDPADGATQADASAQ